MKELITAGIAILTAFLTSIITYNIGYRKFRKEKLFPEKLKAYTKVTELVELCHMDLPPADLRDDYFDDLLESVYHAMPNIEKQLRELTSNYGFVFEKDALKLIEECRQTCQEGSHEFDSVHTVVTAKGKELATTLLNKLTKLQKAAWKNTR